MAVKWDSSDYRRNSSAQSAWALENIAGLTIPDDAIVLDVGCGDGHISAELAGKVPMGRVIGIDASPEMIALARNSFSGATNLRFEVMDARSVKLPERIDLAFSNAALHWIREQDAFLASLRKNMAAGGRLSFNCGGKGNAADVFTAAGHVIAQPRWAGYFAKDPTQPENMPYSFLGPDDYIPLLETNGFRPDRVELVPRIMTQKGRTGLAGWVRTTWMPITNPVPEGMRDFFVDAIVDDYLTGHPMRPDGSIEVGMSRLVVQATAL